MMSILYVSSLFLSVPLGHSIYVASGPNVGSADGSPRMGPMASLLARGSSRTQASLSPRDETGLFETKGDSYFGGSTAEDFSDPDWAGFIQETQKGAKHHKQYDDVVKKVAAEREVDIDIHSGFGDLEQADRDEEQWLRQDSD